MKPSIIKKEDKVFLAVPPSIIIFLFRHKKKDIVILEHIEYLNMEKLLEILKDGFGYLAISAYDPNLGEGLIFVNMSRTGDEYITVTPCTLNFKLMEAIYSILS